MSGMPQTTTGTDKKQEFALAFKGLRVILKPYDKKLRVTKDKPGDYMSESKSLRYQGKPVMFAGITTKSYVSFHLFPVYMFPNLLDGISPELKKRMQGKPAGISRRRRNRYLQSWERWWTQASAGSKKWASGI